MENPLHQAFSATALAAVVKLTADKHERSWKTTSGEGQGYYNLDLNAAAAEACKELKVHEAFAQPVYYLLRYTWNDILDWSDDQIKS